MLAWADEDGQGHAADVFGSSPSKWQRSPARSGAAVAWGHSRNVSFGRKSGAKFKNDANGDAMMISLDDDGEKTFGRRGGGKALREARERSASPTKKRPPPLDFGVDKPNLTRSQTLPMAEDARSLVGKTLTSVRRSAEHPTLFLNFSDHTSYQVLVAGYDPSLSRDLSTTIKRKLELATFLDPLIIEGQTTAIDLTIADCAIIRLVDKAFELLTPTLTEDVDPFVVNMNEKSRWDQDHKSLAFKFEGVNGWHCVSAIVSEENKEIPGEEIFRSYEDIYVKSQPPPSPRKSYQHSKRRNSGWSFSSDTKSEASF